MRTCMISKLSRNGLPYCVTTNDLPAEDPKTLHWYLKQKVCEHHGWGTYTISRSHAYGETRGYKLVAKLRLSKEGITVLKNDPRYPVYPEDPYKHSFWEKGSLRYVEVGLQRTRESPSLTPTVSRFRTGDMVPLMKARGRRRDWS